MTWFVERKVPSGSDLYTHTGDHSGDNGSVGGYRHWTVKHCVGVHTNTPEPLWSMFKRGFVGTCQRMLFKHLHRHVSEFAGCKNIRELNSVDRVGETVRGMEHKRLCFRGLVT